MPDDLARFLGREFARLYHSPEAQLENACEDRGVELIPRQRLSQPGFYASDPWPHIAYQPNRPNVPRPLGHELFHAWVERNAFWEGDYRLPEWEQVDPEEAAEEFAEMVVPDEEQARRAPEYTERGRWISGRE